MESLLHTINRTEIGKRQAFPISHYKQLKHGAHVVVVVVVVATLLLLCLWKEQKLF